MFQLYIEERHPFRKVEYLAAECAAFSVICQESQGPKRKARADRIGILLGIPLRVCVLFGVAAAEAGVVMVVQRSFLKSRELDYLDHKIR